MFSRRTLSIIAALVVSNICSAATSATQQVEADWLRQEQVSRLQKAGTEDAVKGVLARGRKMIADLKSESSSAAAKTESILDGVEEACALASTEEQWMQLYRKSRRAVRELAFSNPAIDFDELLFVKRYTPTYQHQCAHRVGESQLPGSDLCLLKGLNPDGNVQGLLTGEFTQGGIGRPDISFDGKRLVFPFARLRPQNKRKPFKPLTWGGTGLCEMYDIYEMNIDGSGVRQVTTDMTSEDTEPCYIPGGRIAFTSSRNKRMVQCGDWALVNGIYTIKPDGTDIYKVTEPQDGEFYPSILEDGRIMYTRWDYVMKPYNTQQQLWAVNPDGRRAELVYGDYYNFGVGPMTLFEARQIPGTSKVIATGAAHHNNCAGPIMVVDMNKNRGDASGMQTLTPEVHYPEVKRKGGGSTRDSKTGWYSSPYPLTEKHYLVSYSFGPKTSSTYGIYLMDIHGNKELIYQMDDKFSCYSPIPVRPRKEPRVIPNLVKGVDYDKPATMIVNDVYQGLLREGVKRGEVKHLRILEVRPKMEHTIPRRMDVGVNSGWDTRTVLGTVPVEDDGSIHFQLPPHKLILLEALDKDYLEIKRMRNYMNVKQGEVVSCIGCHEPYGMTPPNMSKMPTASLRPPSQIIPPPFPVRGMSFKHIVQPVLDKHCVSCHDGSKELTTDGSKSMKKAFSLKGDEMVIAPRGYDKDEGPQHAVSQSFLNLLKYVEYVKVGNYGTHNPAILVPSKANTIGSRASKLMKVLKQGHHDVALPLAEWRAIAAWIDCNAPYYGDFSEITTEADINPNYKMNRWLKLDNRPKSERKEKKLSDDQSAIPAALNLKFAVTDLRLGKGMIIENGKVIREYPVKSATDIKFYAGDKLLISGPREVVLLDSDNKKIFHHKGKELFTADLHKNGNILINDSIQHAVIEKDLNGKEVSRTSTAITSSTQRDHYHALHMRQLDNGDFWIAHRHNNIARKYNKAGDVIRTIKMPCSVTSVEELSNGNVLVSGGAPGPAKVIEFDANDNKVWELSADDVPQANLMTPCGVQRLPNGNTLITNWTGHNYKGKYLPLIEVNKQKKIVRAFTDTTILPEPVGIQLL